MEYSQSTQPIAIVGMAMRFPGAGDANGLWDILEQGRNTLSKIPSDRFDYACYSGINGRSGRSMNTTHGNFIDGHDVFDNAFFHISPREARSMDPQQRLLLHVAMDSLEDAGYVPDASSLNTETFATYVGVSTRDYMENLRNNIDVYYITGTLQSFLSGKIAHAFGFGGTSIVLDTACSGSVVAINLACRALQNRDCNAALAGGVNVITSPDAYLGLSRGHFISDSGQCRPWDASADGYSRADGCGLFVLKRLDDALRENDRIWGVIRGVEVNQSANAQSITRPLVSAQVALYQKLVSSAGVHPLDISVAECHGTGTQAGDPVELEAVRAVFGPGRTADNPLHITSVKANIGHAEAASGAASLAKLVLMMRERTIPRHISFSRLNPRIPDLSTDNLCIDTAAIPWDPRGQRRLALLTNFGAAGSNAALIVEEHVRGTPRRRTGPSKTGFVVGLSCRSVEAAEKRRQDYVARLEGTVQDDDEASLQDFCYSATARRQLHPYRISASGLTKEEVLHSLRTVPIVEVGSAESAVVFVFSGQSSQYLGMGADLYRELSFVAEFVDTCDRTLVRLGFASVLAFFKTPDAYARTIDPHHSEVMQSALFILECVLARLLMEWGVTPSFVVGHSFGEFAALVIAGVMTLDDGLSVVATRARLINDNCVGEATAMSSVRAPPEAIASLLDACAEMEICCYNSESHCTVGGPREQVTTFEQLCSAQGIRSTRLEVSYAYHSAAMDPILDPLRTLGSTISFSPPQIPIVSTVTGTLVQPGDTTPFSADYFVRHCREPVRFHEGMSAVCSYPNLSTITAYIELGPHPSTISLLRGLQSDDEKLPLLLPALRKNAPEFQVLCGTLAQLYCTAVPVKWRSVFQDLAPDAELVDLPAYPFAQTRFWVPYEEYPPQLERSERDARPRSPSSFTRVAPILIERDMSTLAELVDGHSVAGVSLCPASVYVELVQAAAMPTSGKTTDVVEIAKCVISKALVRNPTHQVKLRLEMTPSPTDPHTGSFMVSSVTFGTSSDPDSEHGQEVHCTGSYKRKTAADVAAKLQYARPMLEREIRNISTSSSAQRETFSTRTVYELLMPPIVSYSKPYRAIHTITVDTSLSTAYAVVQLPKSAMTLSATSPSAINAIFLDTLFHVAGFLVNFSAGMNGGDAYICSQVDKVRLLPGAIDPSALYGVYASIVHIRQRLAVLEVHAVEFDEGDRYNRGRVLGALKRVHFQKVTMTSFSRALKVASGLPPVEDPPRAVEDAAKQSTFPRYDMQDHILRIIAEVSGIAQTEIRFNALLTHLGIDSLMIWELLSRLHSALPGSVEVLNSHILADAVTVRDFVRVVSDTYGFSRAREESTTPSTTTLYDADKGDVDPTPPVASTRSAAPVTTRSVASCSAVIGHDAVKSILSSVLDIPTPNIADDAELSSLGLDSFTCIEACHYLHVNLGIRLDKDTVLTCRTITDIVNSCQARSTATHDIPSHTSTPGVCLPSVVRGMGPELLRLQTAPTGTQHPPLLLIHDGSGLVSGYAKLAPLGRDVWAIQNPAMSSQDAPGGETLVLMATTYVALLSKDLFRPDEASRRECIIGGWSFGGVVAFEMSRQLRALGVVVRGLVFIDSPAPQTSSTLPHPVVAAIAEKATASTGSRRAGEVLAAQMRYAGRALVAYDRMRPTVSKGPHPPAVMLQSREGAAFLPDGWDAGVDPHIRSFFTKQGDETTIPWWEEALGAKLDVLSIPGDHYAAFSSDNIKETSEQLRNAVALLSPEACQ